MNYFTLSGRAAARPRLAGLQTLRGRLRELHAEEVRVLPYAQAFVILAVLLTVAQAPVPATGQAADNPPFTGRYDESHGKNSNRPPHYRIESTSKRSGYGEHQPPSKEESTGQIHESNKGTNIVIGEAAPVAKGRDVLDWILGVSQAILATGGLFGLIFAWRTVRSTAKNATAALMSATSYVNTERARLVTEISANEELQFVVIARNWGKAPARVTYSTISAEVVNVRAELPPVPIYLSGTEYTRDELIARDGIAFVGDNTTDSILDPISPELKEAVELSNMILWVFGMVCYEDTVTSDEYELRFCYRCDWYRARPMMLSGGPAAYNGETKRPAKTPD